MAKALIVLSPPSSFPEAFLDFCQPKLQVSQPIVLYFQAELEVCAKKLGDLSHAGAITYLSRWSGAHTDRIREEGLRQAQDCVFLLTGEEMDRLCAFEGTEIGVLALRLEPSSGLQWVLRRSDFQAYLQARMDEPWRGEPLPQLNLQMHLSVMRESILAGLREELSRQPGDWTAVLRGLERKVGEEVKKATQKLEETQRVGLERVMEAALRAVAEAQSSFEAGRASVERQAQTLLQEQGNLTAVLTEASSALRSANALREKVSLYEETNRTVQQVLHSLHSSMPVPPNSTQPAVAKPPQPADSPKPSQPVASKPSQPAVPPKPSQPAIYKPPPPPLLPNPTQPDVSPKPQPAVEPAPENPFYGRGQSGDSITEHSVTIEEIDEAQNNLDQLKVVVNNLLTKPIEGAEMVLLGSPLQALRDKVPVLPPGRSQFLLSANCLPEAASASFLLRKDSLPISFPITISLGVEDPADLQPNEVQAALSKSNSLPPSFNHSARKSANLAELTAEQTARFKAAMHLLGGNAELNLQEKIKKLVQDPTHAGKSADQLLELSL